jgi:hypothetical protein
MAAPPTKAPPILTLNSKAATLNNKDLTTSNKAARLRDTTSPVLRWVTMTSSKGRTQLARARILLSKHRTDNHHRRVTILSRITVATAVVAALPVVSALV